VLELNKTNIRLRGVGDMKFKYKNVLYRWSISRLITNLFIILIVLIIGSVYFTNHTNAKTDTFQMKIVVKNGDTLWSIAEKYADGSSDPRKMVAMIQKVNNLSNSSLRTGQELTLVFDSI
jgi:LysM repeat protein